MVDPGLRLRCPLRLGAVLWVPPCRALRIAMLASVFESEWAGSALPGFRLGVVASDSVTPVGGWRSRGVAPAVLQCFVTLVSAGLHRRLIVGVAPAALAIGPLDAVRRGGGARRARGGGRRAARDLGFRRCAARDESPSATGRAASQRGRSPAVTGWGPRGGPGLRLAPLHPSPHRATRRQQRVGKIQLESWGIFNWH
jgi:hypothetical protein